MLLQGDRHLRVAVAGQVHQAPRVVQDEEIEQLGTSRGFRGARQVGVSEGVQRARLAGIGAPGESDFQAFVGGALVDLGGTDEKAGLLAQADDGVLL